VRWFGRDRWCGRAQPHVDGASLRVVEEWPEGAAPALAGSRCGGATGAVAATPTTAAVAMTMVTTTATATASPATTATVASAEGSRRSRTT
jgi:hypothetical protein